MTVTAKPLIPAVIAPNSQTTEYTSPVSGSGGKGTIIDKFTATNYSGSSATLSVNLVTLGDTAGNQNLVLKAVSINAGATYLCPEITGQVLGPGDFISVIAGTATAINIRASGREIT